MKIPVLPVTPITEETFKRQGWVKHPSLEAYDEGGDFSSDDFLELPSDEQEWIEDENLYYWTLNLPKSRTDGYSPMLVSSLSNGSDGTKDMLKPGQYFVDIFDLGGLGFCTSEEELEVLYYLLTKKHIED